MAQGGSNHNLPILKRVVIEKMEVLSSQGSWLTGNEQKLFLGKIGCREQGRGISTVRPSEHWDMLPRELVESLSLEILKILLCKLWITLDKALFSTESWTT